MISGRALTPHQCQENSGQIAWPVRCSCYTLWARTSRKTCQTCLTDNTTAMFYLNRQGGAHPLPCVGKQIQLWEFCIAHSIHLEASQLLRARMSWHIASAGLSPVTTNGPFAWISQGRFSAVRDSPYRTFYNLAQQEVSPVLLPARSQLGISLTPSYYRG